MKRILALCAALLLVPVVAHADLVAHFRFDDDLKDVTGQHDGRPVDPKLAPSFAPGRVGNAVVIEKVNAGIELANTSMSDFTLATWVNVGNDYAEMPVLFKGRAKLAAAHNAMMSWGHRRPQPLESPTAEMPDALGVTRTMKIEKWAWLIGLSDAEDARLLEWSSSFGTPPKVEAEGSRLQSPSYNTERRATRLTGEKPVITLTITPSTSCVHPVFELQNAPKILSLVELNGRELAATDYAWDGRVLWLNATLREPTNLCLTFHESNANR